MIDLTKITLDEANKIELALIFLEKEIIEKAKASEYASMWGNFPERIRNIMKSNGEWWREVHALLFEDKRR